MAKKQDAGYFLLTSGTARGGGHKTQAFFVASVVEQVEFSLVLCGPACIWQFNLFIFSVFLFLKRNAVMQSTLVEVLHRISMVPETLRKEFVSREVTRKKSLCGDF